MAGHSKWAQIKRQKGANDVARSALFAKLARRITVESKKAKGDVNSPSLRATIDAAKTANMPKENIERAVAKGSAAEAASLEQVTYECYGPGGAAIIIEAVTDNRNRTSQEMKHLLSKNGLSLASTGSALWAFEKGVNTWMPKTTVSLSETDDQALMKIMEEIDAHDDVQEVYTNAE
ncbi:YebC/PmpR family DNA-binding transcriptional regulator [Candidatus Uhrbacteria bacterium]|nr:YebC/PmpR family DNA-binding transcriptional regulator [Candidatus Uhrbacteria bacterium]